MKRWMIVAACFLVLSACGTGAPPTEEQLDLVVTANEPDFAFARAATYAIPDKVVAITDPDSEPEEVDTELSRHVLDEIERNLADRGYSKVDSGDQPDIFVEVAQMKTVNADVYYNYWPTYWGTYYGTYYPGAYGAGWAVAPYPYVTSSTFGSLIVNVTNPNAPDEDKKQIPTVWVAVLNGVVDDSSQAEIRARVDEGIAQAFEQSPYFTRSNP